MLGRINYSVRSGIMLLCFSLSFLLDYFSISSRFSTKISHDIIRHSSDFSASMLFFSIHCVSISISISRAHSKSAGLENAILEEKRHTDSEEKDRTGLWWREARRRRRG